MEYWFTSDFHLGHYNIIRYCDRPFKDLEQMNRTIIRNHNSRVKPEDTVFFLGDFCFKNSKGGKEGEGALENAQYYLNQLNGNFVFIKGNHDDNNSLKTCISGCVINLGGQDIYLTHRPEDIEPNIKLNFVGHVHESWKFKREKGVDMINVGVDVNNFMPVTFNEIMNEYNKWKK